MVSPPNLSPRHSAARKSETLYLTGLVLVITSSLLHFLWRLPGAAWALALSGGLTVLAMMLKGAFGRKVDSSVRSRRLDGMRLLGGLLFLTAGGFAAQGESLWILLFAGGTVFTLYGIFVGEKTNNHDQTTGNHTDL